MSSAVILIGLIVVGGLLLGLASTNDG